MPKIVAGLVALLAAAGAAALAWHHPVAPLLLLAAAAAAAAFATWSPPRWPSWLLPALPLVGFMPWTGWLLTEELDVLLLATAAGVYARWAVSRRPHGPASGASAPSAPSLAVWWLLPVAVSVALAAWVGVNYAGGWAWGWWQGYREPMNSLRLVKPVALTLLLLPAWRRSLRQEPEATIRSLHFGMVGLLASTALTVWWERLAYTGLLDFSTDYRATGLFWEMHVGGAALDAALALSFPFALAALAVAHGRRQWLVAVLALALGAYAALSTFSRVVYVGVPLALAVTAWLGRRSAPALAWRPMLLWAVLGGLMAALLFPAGGYRQLLAGVGACALLLALAGPARALPVRAWVWGLFAGALAAVAVTAFTAFVPKGAYLAYALAWLAASAAILAWRRDAGRQGLAAASLAGLLAVLAATVAVGVNWGGPDAWLPGLLTAAALFALLLAVSVRAAPAWPDTLRWQGQALTLVVVLCAVVAVFDGGAYMAQRLTHVGADGAGRQQHWERALSRLNGPDWLLGKGLGSFATEYGLSGRTVDQVGDYRLAQVEAGHGQVLVLTGGKHTLGHGEIFRVAQRIAVPARGRLVLDMAVRAPAPTNVHMEVCEKHLLYPVNCADQTLAVPKPAPDWQTLRFELKDVKLSSGSWWAPRWVVFAIALDTPGRRVEIDNLQLRDALGNDLLLNGDFEKGLARWFTSSDRHHMPWHAKNVAVHLLFEQGMLGLLTAAVAIGMALWRVALGAAHQHPLAPALAGALIGVAVVGVGDSLLNMPRIAWCIWWLVAVALSLPSARPARAQASPAPHRSGRARRS